MDREVWVGGSKYFGSGPDHWYHSFRFNVNCWESVTWHCCRLMAKQKQRYRLHQSTEMRCKAGTGTYSGKQSALRGLRWRGNVAQQRSPLNRVVRLVDWSKGVQETDSSLSMGSKASAADKGPEIGLCPQALGQMWALPRLQEMSQIETKADAEYYELWCSGKEGGMVTQEASIPGLKLCHPGRRERKLCLLLRRQPPPSPCYLLSSMFKLENWVSSSTLPHHLSLYYLWLANPMYSISWCPPDAIQLFPALCHYLVQPITKSLSWINATAFSLASLTPFLLRYNPFVMCWILSPH